jgi:hypothetical protein
MGFSADKHGAQDAPSSRRHLAPGTAGSSLRAGGDTARIMVERIIRSGPTSHAEALKTSRAAFPDSPLTVRAAALAILMRRGAGNQLPR